MLGPSHLLGFAGTTQMILFELGTLDAYDMILLPVFLYIPKIISFDFQVILRTSISAEK